MSTTEVEPEIIDAESRVLTPTSPGMMQVKSSYATAVMVQRPRKLPEVERRFLEEAMLAGESFYYGWSAGGQLIEGPSQELAHALARCWMNCAIELGEVQETREAWYFTTTFVDLETGVSIPRQFRQSKRSIVHGKLDEERKDDIRFQIGQSKAVRNVILHALPKWLIEKGVATAKEGVSKRLDDAIAKQGIHHVISIMVAELAKLGVKPEAICQKFGVAKVDGLTKENLITMRGDLKALQAGQDRPEALYPMPAEPGKEQPTGESKSKRAGEAMKQRRERKQQQNTGPTNTTPAERSVAGAENSAGGDAAESGQGSTLHEGDLPTLDQVRGWIAEASTVTAVQAIRVQWASEACPLLADEKDAIAEACDLRIAQLQPQPKGQGELPLTGGYVPQ